MIQRCMMKKLDCAFITLMTVSKLNLYTKTANNFNCKLPAILIKKQIKCDDSETTAKQTNVHTYNTLRQDTR